MVSDIRRWAGTRVARWQPELGDGALYAASAVFAAIVIASSGRGLYRQWANLAIGPYVAAALLSLAIGLYHRRRATSEQLQPQEAAAVSTAVPTATTTRALVRRSAPRIAVFFVVLFGATLVPLALEVHWRSDGNAALHVQPEVSVVEQAAHRVAHDKDPYRVVYRHGHAVVSTPGEPEYENFFPYGPLMSVFGLPSTDGPIQLTDARIFFSIFTLLVTAIALFLCRGPREPRARALQVLTVLPTAALPLATGGDDMPVVAVLLLAMVMAQRRKSVASGFLFGAAIAMKFTAWPLAALALFAARDGDGRRRPGRMAAGMAVVVLPSVLPFMVNNATAFMQNVVLYPLGLAGVRSPAASPMPGHLLVNRFPELHRVLPLVFLLVGGAVLLRYLQRRPPRNAAEVCSLAGWVMTVAILLAPATRVGYLLYPINFFVWAALFRGADREAAPEVTGDEAAALATSSTGNGARVGAIAPS